MKKNGKEIRGTQTKSKQSSNKVAYGTLVTGKSTKSLTQAALRKCDLNSLPLGEKIFVDHGTDQSFVIERKRGEICAGCIWSGERKGRDAHRVIALVTSVAVLKLVEPGYEMTCWMADDNSWTVVCLIQSFPPTASGTDILNTLKPLLLKVCQAAAIATYLLPKDKSQLVQLYHAMGFAEKEDE